MYARLDSQFVLVDEVGLDERQDAVSDAGPWEATVDPRVVCEEQFSVSNGDSTFTAGNSSD